MDYAGKHGKPDHYQGKRRWTRYAIGTRLEVTTDRRDPAATWTALMHNISGGGIGLWSKRAVQPKGKLYVREWTDNNSGLWLPATVKHCSEGLAGHLLGAEFDVAYRGPSASDHAMEAFDREAFAEALHEQSLPRFSLPLRSALVAAVCSGVGATAAALACHWVWPDPWRLGAPVLAVWFAIAAGGLIGWLSAGSDTRFVETLRTATRRLVDGQPDSGPPRRAATRELAVLRLAYLELAYKLRQRVDSERGQKEKLQELNQIKANILAIVSHDLRTPLTSIMLYAKMMEDELTILSQQDQRQFLQVICDECTRLSNLVGDLLEVQRLESGRIQWNIHPQDVSRTLHACAQSFLPLAASQSITFTVDCPRVLPEIEIDADRIHQVLSNLLSNAFKYAPSGGRVHLAAETRGNEILIRVADDGPGIPRDRWDQIFDRFTRLSDPNVSPIAGFGLGLYIVRQIVERHGGKVWVESEPGEGSEFFVSLPRRAPAERPSDRPKVEGGQGRVLVCDADPELAATIAQVLREENFEARAVSSACRLLAQLDQSTPDIVLTDVLLPDMNAAELLDALSNRPSRQFRLVIHSYAGDGPALRRRGVAVFLRRPAYKDELVKAVHVAMNKPAGTAREALLIEAGEVAAEAFNGALAKCGFMPIVMGSLAAAATMLKQRSVDAVLAPCSLLSRDWAELRNLTRLIGRDVSVAVLCRRVGRRERRLAAAYGAIPLVYRPGREHQVARAVAAYKPYALATESCG